MKGKAFLLVLILVVAGAGFWVKGVFDRANTLTEETEPFYVRYEGATVDEILGDLQERKVIHDREAFQTVAKWTGVSLLPRTGTFEFQGGMTMAEVAGALTKPVQQMVRIPEGWWIARTARRLEERGVCPAQEYIDLAGQPGEFEGVVEFELPDGSLEGYLYPDTYDLPPLLGARGVIERQLKAFEEKVVKKVGEDGLERALIVGSMVETEAALDEERPMVAGVIENRMAQGMRLQIDATVLYGLQEWRRLERGEVNRVDSPYNTYRINGLPPGPICSPSIKSIEAAFEPAEHPYLFYVRGEGLSHLWSRTYAEHLANIRKSNEIRRREAEEQAQREQAGS